jgi:hypothetical protein
MEKRTPEKKKGKKEKGTRNPPFFLFFFFGLPFLSFCLLLPSTTHAHHNGLVDDQGMK